jgi:hypothetical protein
VAKSPVKRTGQTLADVVKRIQDSAVTVGIHSDAGTHDEAEGMTVAQIGAIHEFGGGNSPERSFLRRTLGKKRAKYISDIQKIAKSAIQGKRDARDGMGLLGRQAEGDIKLTIRDMKDPPNAPSTIKQKKGVDNPLQDTDQMLNSIRWQYEDMQ